MAQIFVDTTIQVDRVIKEHDQVKKAAMDAMLSQYNFILTFTYSRLEFKRVILQNLALCLEYIMEEGSYFSALNRVTSQSQYRPRRVATLVSIMAWLGKKVSGVQDVEIGGTQDEILTCQGEAILRVNILYLWKRFEKSVGSLLDRTGCSRAKEPPKLGSNGKLSVAIPQGLCQNRECNNANFFRAQLPMVNKICGDLDRLEQGGAQISDELKKARAELRLALSDPVRLYNYKNCLAVGDVWIHLESLVGGVKDFGTTNYKESQHLCPIMGLKMKQPY